jgi:uncharacterized protein YggE
MKNFTRNSIILAIVVITFLAGIPGIKTVFAQGPTPDKKPGEEANICDTKRTINVTGSAAINIPPDRALILFGVQSNGITVDSVQFDNDKAIQNVFTAVRKQGVELSDITTNFYMIEPIYENYDSLYIKGYRINNTVSVTVRDVTKTSSILAAALKAGVNQVNGVSFYSSTLRKFRDQARDLAMVAAREKAAALASTTDAKIGCVININENSWSYFNNPWSSASRNPNTMTQNVTQNNVSAGGTTSTTGDDEPISSGTISVKAEVTVTYSLQ